MSCAAITFCALAFALGAAASGSTSSSAMGLDMLTTSAGFDIAGAASSDDGSGGSIGLGALLTMAGSEVLEGAELRVAFMLVVSLHPLDFVLGAGRGTLSIVAKCAVNNNRVKGTGICLGGLFLQGYF
ncbi:hypothetical protein PAXRUDRAFT_28753 [Paxillus rubicundulus Ve08.2h10]|uniref:Secreted protein n=1 Tax=Paxillus rubicundulus Ve08.2h10 TaxID=930991 RepID=A0A0D0C3N5_9AGAM|nr:hypothetical protein PAXRUDRAFT_28753 [Paxillus rubicundulus Ve08.2h10]